MTAGHRPAYSSGQHDGKPQLRAILDGFGERFGKYVLNLAGAQPRLRADETAGARRPHHRGDRRRPAGARPDRCKWADCKGPPWVAFRAIHHGFVKLTVRAEGIALEAICARRVTRGEDTVRCADGQIIDQALINAGAAAAPRER